MNTRPASPATARWQRTLVVLLLSCLASCVGDCGLFCEVYSLGVPLAVEVYLEDARGNPILVDSASIQQGNDTFGCTVDESTPRVGCNKTIEGRGILSVQALGQTITRDVDVGVTSKGSCDYKQEVELRLPGLGCSKPRGTAITGRFLDTQGREIVGGTVTAQLYGQHQKCRVTGARFQCESMSPYSASYTLKADFGVSSVEREVFVIASQCQVEPTDASISLAEACAPDGPQVPAAVAIVTMADAATTQARIVNEERSVPCTRVSTEPNPELEFDCPALSATGGGTYHVVVEVGNLSQSKLVEVTDNGCTPNSAVLWFDF